MKSILINSKLCFGPMSKNIVDTLIDFSNKTKTPITFIPSRRQVEWNGGYVNNWTTETFTKYVKSKSRYAAIQRDHGGPGQGLYDDDGYESLKHDCKYLDAIHIDPWKKYPKFEDGLKWTVDILKFCYNENPNLYFEIATEEAIRKFSAEEIERLLHKVKHNIDKNIFERILFCVIQSGTALKDGINTGKYSSDRLVKMLNAVKTYQKLSKEHNGDYMDKNIMINRFKTGLDSLNIAPEVGVFETKQFLKNLNDNYCEKKIDLFYNICYNSGKWKKWVSEDFKPEKNKIKLIEICGHYVFSHKDFINNIKNTVDASTINENLYEYFIKVYENTNKFYYNSYLRDVTRVHPPEDTQKIDNRLRLHRAERLYDFPNDFFNTFINNLSQKNVRYYPYIQNLKRKLAKHYKLKVHNFFLNNGSSENIKTFYKALGIHNKNVLLTKPCYPMHEVYAKLNNMKITSVCYDSTLNWDVNDMLNKINKNICCVVIANPNSPIGDIKTIDEIEKIIMKTNKLSIPILIDEAYIEYSDNISCVSLLDKYDNLVISRTFSKALGCAGLRIGYLIGNYFIMNVLQKFVATYEISNISAKFGEYLLDNYHVVDNYVDLIKKEKILIKKLCDKHNIPLILNHINTIHIKPKNISVLEDFCNKNNYIGRFRVLPHDNEKWMALVLFPDLVNHELFKNIIDCNK